MSQYHREQLKLLNVEIENAQRLIHVHEKRDEENQKIISETKGKFISFRRNLNRYYVINLI